MTTDAVGSFYAGVDLGGTKIAALVARQSGGVLGEAVVPTDATSPVQLIRGIRRAVDEALRQAEAGNQALAAIGAGVPGLVDPASGRVQIAVNLNLEDYDLGKALSAEFAVPVSLENDVKAATVGAYHYLQGAKSIDNMVYISVGTGIAAGFILDGRLYRGTHGLAGEIGHVIVEPNGVRCRCGQHGCLETIVSGPAIARQAAPYLNGDSRTFTAREVYSAALEGDPQAKAVVQHVSATMARLIQWLIMAFDVKKVVLGGGVTKAGDAFLAPILEELTRMRANSTLAQTMLSEKKIILLPGHINPGLLGALQMARQSDGAPFRV